MDRRPTPKLSVSLIEVLVIIAITSTLFAVLYPAVEMARSSNNQPPAIPWLSPYVDYALAVPPVAIVISAFLMLFIRQLSPPWLKRRIPWRKKRG